MNDIPGIVSCERSDGNNMGGVFTPEGLGYHQLGRIDWNLYHEPEYKRTLFSATCAQGDHRGWGLEVELNPPNNFALDDCTVVWKHTDTDEISGCFHFRGECMTTLVFSLPRQHTVVTISDSRDIEHQLAFQ